MAEEIESTAQTLESMLKKQILRLKKAEDKREVIIERVIENLINLDIIRKNSEGAEKIYKLVQEYAEIHLDEETYSKIYSDKNFKY